MIDKIGSHHVPATDSALNELMTQAIGNKSDTVLYAPTAADSLMRYTKGILESVRDTLDNLAIVEHHAHSRCRVYPQDVGATITLAANAAANTFGNWTQIVPITTIGFLYEVIGMVIESVNAVTTYFFQLGFSTTDGDDPTTAQILGERRINLVTVPIAKATELLHFHAQDCPANAKLWGRLKTASINADQAEVSVVILRHIEITNPVTPLVTWPWT